MIGYVRCAVCPVCEVFEAMCSYVYGVCSLNGESTYVTHRHSVNPFEVDESTVDVSEVGTIVPSVQCHP